MSNQNKETIFIVLDSDSPTHLSEQKSTINKSLFLKRKNKFNESYIIRKKGG